MRRVLLPILFNIACAASPGQAQLVEADVLVPREGAKALSASFSMGAGELEIRGGACELARARMRYDAASSVPDVDYTVDEQGFATLTVREEGRRSGRSANWSVCLTDALPLELRVDLGAGDSKVVLDRVQLRSLVVTVGAGDAEVDLRGSILAGTEVTIDGGAGELDLSVPNDVGVRVRADEGVGEIETTGLRKEGDVLVNDAWGKSELSVDVRIDLGVGTIRVSAQ